MSEEPRRHAEQQGDGQPENARELEDPAGGAALAAGAERDESERDESVRDESTRGDASEARGLRDRPASSRGRDEAPHGTRDADP